MNDKTKLILALLQVDNLTNLLKDNEYVDYFNVRLTQMRVELQRQLENG